MKRITLLVILFVAVSLLAAGSVMAAGLKKNVQVAATKMNFTTLTSLPCQKAIQSYKNAKNVFERCWNLKGLDAILSFPLPQTVGERAIPNACISEKNDVIEGYAHDKDITLPPLSDVGTLRLDIAECNATNIASYMLFKYQACQKCAQEEAVLDHNDIDCVNIFND